MSVAQTIRWLPTMPETWVRSQGEEDPLEKEMATLSSTLTWKIPWTEERGRLQSMGSQRAGHNWASSLTFTLYCVSYKEYKLRRVYCVRWRRKWQPTPAWRIPWREEPGGLQSTGLQELDRTEVIKPPYCVRSVIKIRKLEIYEKWWENKSMWKF